MPVNGFSGQTSVNQSYTDLSSLDSIKSLGRDKNPEAITEVAKQFESFFIRELLKEMRKTVDVFASDNPLNSNELQFHQQMYDQQLSLELSKNSGIGLAEVLASQLSNQYNLGWDSENSTDLSSYHSGALTEDRLPVNGDYTAVRQSIAEIGNEDEKTFESKTDFIEFLMPLAKKVARDLNVPANVLVAQAALETGWGKFINSSEQKSSFNLFNIKSDNRWTGDSIQVQTLEFDDGVAYQDNASFRAYRDFEHSLNDYVDFIKTNPRYDDALKVAQSPNQYVVELQKAGYATDPDYAAKIITILTQIELVE